MMNMRDMLGESGRTMSNMDFHKFKSMLSPPPQMSTRPSIPNIPMSDNEPRFEMRTPEGQMFTIDSMINNLMQEYDMVVRNQEFDRAQAVANEIDKLQQQKIAIQAQNVPQQDQISRILDDISI